MENLAQINNLIRLKLLDRCFKLGLPASSDDDITTLNMYLGVDSILGVESISFPVELKPAKKIGIKSRFLNMFMI